MVAISVDKQCFYPFRCGYTSSHSHSHKSYHRANNHTLVKRDIGQHRDDENEIPERRRSGKGPGSSAAGTKNSQPNSNLELIKGPWNANSRSRYVELLLVVDHKEFVTHGKDLSEEKALKKIYRICKVANIYHM